MKRDESLDFLRCHELKGFLEDVRKKSPKLMLSFGDSNTCNAHYAEGSKAWGELLHSEMRDQLQSQSLLYLNSSISGDCVKKGLARWETDVHRFQPDLAFFCMGSNDAKRLSPELFRELTNEVLDRFKAMGTLVVMRTPIPVMEYDPKPEHFWDGDRQLKGLCSVIRDIADERELPFVDVYRRWWALESEGKIEVGHMYTDAVHANAKGHQIVCQTMLKAFGLSSDFVWQRKQNASADGSYLS
jgi:lysophospholipase L1-like esterase